MAFSSQPDFLVLHAVRLKGMADSESVADVMGLPLETTHEVASDLSEQQLLDHKQTKVVSGWRLTAEGRERHQAALVDDVDRSGCAALLDECYRVFLDLNETLKVVCTDWQLRTDGSGTQVPNDHSDADHDARVRDRLGVIHGEIVPVADRLGAEYLRFGRYAPRFTRALDRLDGGDHHAFTRPLYGSYHDVWMELHQDLLLTLGRQRGEHDGT